MFIAIDLIIVVIMAAVIFNAVKRGFVSSLFGLVTAVISLILATMFYRELGVYINDSFVHNSIEPRIVDFVKNIVVEQGGEFGAEALRAHLPEDILALMDTFGIELDNIFAGLGTAPDAIAATLAKELSITLSNAIAYGAVFLAAYIALTLVCFILNLIVKLPVLNSINKVFGLLLGVAEAFVLGIIIAKLAVAVCGVYGTLMEDATFTGVIDKTVVAKFLLSVCPW